jgi:hypothetical protein
MADRELERLLGRYGVELLRAAWQETATDPGRS